MPTEKEFDYSKMAESIVTGMKSPETSKEQQDTGSYKDLQVANLTIKTMVDPANLNSTSNLDLDEISDLTDAEYLSCVFWAVPEIDIKRISFIQQKRSFTLESKNFLQIMADMVGHAIPQQSQDSGLLTRLFGGRFK